MGKRNLLSAAEVKNANKPGLLNDGSGLGLQVTAAGGKSWVFRYMIRGRARKLGLGAYPTVSLAKARELVEEHRFAASQGLDPLTIREEKRAAQAARAAKTVTFEEAAKTYIATHEGGWRNPKHRAQWPATLSTYVYPVFGSLPIDQVDTHLVLKALEPIWLEKPETASRVRGRIESVLDWGASRGLRDGLNPARLKGHLENLLQKRSRVKAHRAALGYDEMPGFMKKLRANTSLSGRALEMLILCASRTGEIIGAEWAEIDLKAKVWTIPGNRMKAGREHRVPLSKRVVEILSALPQAGRYIFASRDRHGNPAPLSNMAMLQALRHLTDAGITSHGFRSTFRDWAGDHTTFPREIAEAALAHIVGDGAEQAYRRLDALERRRELMEAWSRYCLSEPAAKHADNIVKIGGAR
jgi:integrase